MEQQKRIALSLLSLRVGIFIVMLFWTLDKFVNPEHSGAVFTHFYGLNIQSEVAFMVIGALELVLLGAFLAGFMKRWSYGLVFLFHAISTLSSWKQYLDPFEHLLFFAAWPMLAACLALYLLRDMDTLLTVGGSRS